MEILWFVIPAMLMPVFLIAWGLMLIFKKDWAWRHTARQLRYVNPQRTSSWEEFTTVKGVLFIVLGLGTGVFILVKVLSLFQ